MNDWTAGYVADIDYVFAYHSELNPLRIRLALLSAGLAVPQIETACELGFGQGLSVNIHAAASPIRWYGTDFNPAQAAFAQEVANESGVDSHLFDQAFNEFCQRDDLPDFDYIGLHGIWSWISDENRAVIVDFVRRKLKVGGVLYISYNTSPGWAAMIPMRDILTQHAEVMGAPGKGIAFRIEAALDFTQRLLTTNPLYAQVNPPVVERIEKLKGQNRNYLAHEYFNQDWLPMPFSRMAQWLTPAKVGFAGSAHYLDHIEMLNLSQDQRTLLSEIPDVTFQQSVRDICTNRQFRSDYWVKGARRLSARARADALRAQRVMLVQPRSEVSLKVGGCLMEVNLQEHLYAPIFDALADHQPRTLGELEAVMAGKANLDHVVWAAMMFVGTGALTVAQNDEAIAQAKPLCEKLNASLLHRAKGNGDISSLASPVTGGGISVSRFEQLFLIARAGGKQHPTEWARFAWEIVLADGQILLKDGQALNTPEKNLAEMTAQATTFAEKRLPVLQALQVV